VRRGSLIRPDSESDARGLWLPGHDLPGHRARGDGVGRGQVELPRPAAPEEVAVDGADGHVVQMVTSLLILSGRAGFQFSHGTLI
jgi:hypothetical protein